MMEILAVIFLTGCAVAGAVGYVRDMENEIEELQEALAKA